MHLRRFGLRYIHVPPDSGDGTVLRAEFGDLALQIVEVAVPVVPGGIGPDLMVAAEVRIVLLVPVHHRVVELQRNPAPGAGPRHLPDDVLPVWSVPNVKIGLSARPQAESVVVLDGQHQILHARLFGEVEPPFRVETARMEFGGQLLILFGRNAVALLLLFVQPVNRVQPPVEKKSQPPLEKPVAAVVKTLHVVSHLFLVYTLPKSAALRKFCAVPKSISWVFRFAWSGNTPFSPRSKPKLSGSCFRPNARHGSVSRTM